MHALRAAAVMLGLYCTVGGLSSAHAEVTVLGTRVVYPAAQREVIINLTNHGERPVLINAWLDTGDANARPETIKVPFTLFPAVLRMDGRKSQALRLMHSGEPMAQDRESVYWLNVLEIPGRKPGDDRNVLQIAVRTRIKLFYRPQGMAGTADDAGKALRWSLIPDPAGSGMALKADNASPYHVNFTEVGLKVGDRHVVQFDRGKRGGMVAPFASQVFPLAGLQAMPASAEVVAKTVNDSGGFVPLLQPLSR